MVTPCRMSGHGQLSSCVFCDHLSCQWAGLALWLKSAEKGKKPNIYHPISSHYLVTLVTSLSMKIFFGVGLLFVSIPQVTNSILN